MAKLTIIGRNGQETTIEGESGRSVMQLVRAAGYDELLALCGGCRSCATCHVHVGPGKHSAVPPMIAEEDDLLEASEFRKPNSRLSCQIVFTEELDGLRVTIAPEG